MSVHNPAMSKGQLSPPSPTAAPILASPSMLRAAVFPTEEVMRAMMTTVGDLTASVASHTAQTDNCDAQAWTQGRRPAREDAPVSQRRHVGRRRMLGATAQRRSAVRHVDPMCAERS